MGKNRVVYRGLVWKPEGRRQLGRPRHRWEDNIKSRREMDVLRRSARKSRLEKIKNENIKEIMGVKGKPDIIDIIEKKRQQWYGHVKRMP
jgi:hypothetical protein